MRNRPFHLRGTDTDPRGFTLVEIAVTILLVGMLFALSVPTVQRLSNTYQLKGATENLAAQMRLARERAIATGRIQHFHFSPAMGADYFLIDHSTGQIPARWNLPKGVTYATGTTLGWNEMKPDGRSLFSGLVVLQDRRGNRDTVSVQTSGLVLTK